MAMRLPLTGAPGVTHLNCDEDSNQDEIGQEAKDCVILVLACAVVQLNIETVGQLAALLLVVVENVQDSGACEVAGQEALTAQIEEAIVFEAMALDAEQLEFHLSKGNSVSVEVWVGCKAFAIDHIESVLRVI